MSATPYSFYQTGLDDIFGAAGGSHEVGLDRTFGKFGQASDAAQMATFAYDTGQEAVNNAANTMAGGLVTPPTAAASAAAAANASQPHVPTGGGGGWNSAGLSLPGGWNASGNQFNYAVPGSFQANSNLYQHGYDASQDTAHHDVGRGSQRQSNFDRVYGWMNAVAKANGKNDIAELSPAQQAAAMSYAVSRLRTDYAKSGGNWAQSGFSGYDKYLSGGQGGGQTATQPGGGGNVNNPQHDSHGGGGGGMQTPQLNGTAVVPGTQTTNGGSRMQLGGLNVDPMYAFQLAQNSPQYAAQLLRLANGQTGRTLSKLGQFRDSLYGRAMQAYLSANGTGAGGGGGSAGVMGDLSGFVNAANGVGGNVMDLIQGRANQIGQTDMSGMTDQDAEKNLRAQVALQSLLTGSLGANSLDNSLENLLYQNDSNVMGSSGQQQSGLGALLANSPYQQAMARFGR